MTQRGELIVATTARPTTVPDWWTDLHEAPFGSETLMATGGRESASVVLVMATLASRLRVVDNLADALRNLVRHREFMGLQLAYAKGSISDDEMTEIFGEYLQTRSVPRPEVLRRWRVLEAFVPDLDADVLASMLNADLGDVMSVMEEASRG